MNHSRLQSLSIRPRSLTPSKKKNSFMKSNLFGTKSLFFYCPKLTWKIIWDFYLLFSLQASGTRERNYSSQLWKSVPADRSTKVLLQNRSAQRAKLLFVTFAREILQTILLLQSAAGTQRRRRVHFMLLVDSPLSWLDQSSRQEQNVQARIHTKHSKRFAKLESGLYWTFIRQRLFKRKYCQGFPFGWRSGASKIA